MPEPTFDPAEVRRVVEDVLARPEYADLEPGLFERILASVLEQLGRALSALEGTGAGTILGVVVLVAALALAGWAVVRFVRGVRRDPSAGVAFEGQVGRSPGDWLADAEEHERAGRLREAARCRYRALVAELAAGGVVEEVPGRTTGEYLEEVERGAPAAAVPFAAVTATFEEAWYGHGEVDALTLTQLAADTGTVRRAALRRVPVAAGGRAKP